MGLDENDEKEKKSLEIKDRLIIDRHELDKRAAKIAKARAIHRQRREREALSKVQVVAGEKSKDYVKNEYGLVDEIKDAETRKAKLRQKLLEAPEIIELQKQLDCAYIRKGLETVLRERELNKKSACSEDQRWDNEHLDKIMKSEADREKDLKQQELNKKIKYRQELQDQIINKYKLKQENYKTSLKERALLEDSLRSIIEEDQLELLRQKMVKEKIKKDIEDFRKAKALWTLREKEAVEEEERKIAEYNQMKDKLEEQVNERKRLEKEEISRKKDIVSNSFTKLEDKIKLEEEIIKKNEAEKDKLFVQKQQDEYIKDRLAKKNLRDFLFRQKEYKLEKIKAEKDEEMQYFHKKMAEFKEDQQAEQMTNEKRRRLKMAYKSCVMRDIEEKRYRKKLEQDKLVQTLKKERDANDEWKSMLAEERKRILNEHTEKLIGYLPPSFLKPSDLPSLPEEVRKFYSEKSQNK